MKYSKSYETIKGWSEGRDDKGIARHQAMIQTIQSKINEGCKIEFAANKRWCVIDGETFNIGLKLFERLIDLGEIVLPSDYAS